MTANSVQNHLEKKRRLWNQPRYKAVTIVDDRTVKGDRKKISRWEEHFEIILNRPVSLQTPDIPASEEDIDISTDPITVDEVKQAIIKKRKCGKAPAEDEVRVEMLKASGEETARLLFQTLQNVWETEHASLYHYQR